MPYLVQRFYFNLQEILKYQSAHQKTVCPEKKYLEEPPVRALIAQLTLFFLQHICHLNQDPMTVFQARWRVQKGCALHLRSGDWETGWITRERTLLLLSLLARHTAAACDLLSGNWNCKREWQ